MIILFFNHLAVIKPVSIPQFHAIVQNGPNSVHAQVHIFTPPKTRSRSKRARLQRHSSDPRVAIVLSSNTGGSSLRR